MKKALLPESVTRRLTDGSLVFSNFALLAVIFQLFVVVKWRAFYFVLWALFAVELVLLAIAFLKAQRRNQVFLAILVVTAVLFRLPLLSNPNGLILTSDNALEALQAVEIQESHQAPFFLFGAIQHNGTLTYLLAAFLFDVFGQSYVVFVLAHLAVFVSALYFLARILEKHLEPTAVRALILVQFVFIEAVLDFSLFLRAGPYLELIFLILAGVWLFERAGTDRPSLGLAAFFLAFAIYTNVFGLLLVVPYLAARLWLSGRGLAKLRILPPIAAGGLAGLWHVAYYVLFIPKPETYGSWFPSAPTIADATSRGTLSIFVRRLGKQTWEIFHNLFDFEFRYGLEFFAREIKGFAREALVTLGRAAVWLSLAVLVAGLVLAVRRLVVRRKTLGVSDWPFLFAVLLVPGVLAKQAVFLQRPFLEPRHNLDLLFLILLSYFFILSALVRSLKLSWKTLAPLGLALAVLSAPSYLNYLRMARLKQADYALILETLRSRGIKTLATDFIITYPLWWLSGRTLEIADSLGPTKMYHFYPDRRARVDAVPLDKKAYLFFQRRYYRGSRHRNVTIILRENLLKELAEKGVPYEVIDLKRYEIIAPLAAEGVGGAEQDHDEPPGR
jgi:hypothetical protein